MLIKSDRSEKASGVDSWAGGPLARLAALGFFLVLLGCYKPPHPMRCLEPVPGEGSTITSTQYKDDTLQRTQDGLTITAHGKWSDHLPDVSIRVQIINNKDSPIRIDFDHFRLVDGDSQNRQLIYNPNELTQPYPATVKSGEQSAFTVQAVIRLEDGKSPKAGQISDRRVDLYLPVILNLQTGEKTDWVFRFRHVDCPEPFR